MTYNKFWRIIHELNNDCECGVTYKGLRWYLRRELSPGEIVRFQEKLETLREQAYRWDLWGVAELVMGYSTEDRFSTFSNWLITQGEQRFKSVLKNPESIANWLNSESDLRAIDTLNNDMLHYSALEAYAELKDHDLPVDKLRVDWRKKPAGRKRWRTKQGLERFYPDLTAKLAAIEEHEHASTAAWIPSQQG